MDISKESRIYLEIHEPNGYVWRILEDKIEAVTYPTGSKGNSNTDKDRMQIDFDM